MREIKFRAWTGDKYVYGPTDGNPSPSWVLAMCSANGIEPEQYTGLKDRDGVEIYEGDVVEYSYDSQPIGPGTVVFGYHEIDNNEGIPVETPCFCVKWNEADYSPLHDHHCRVIGSVHDSKA